jgi:hypothetical protein
MNGHVVYHCPGYTVPDHIFSHIAPHDTAPPGDTGDDDAWGLQQVVLVVVIVLVLCTAALAALMKLKGFKVMSAAEVALLQHQNSDAWQSTVEGESSAAIEPSRP